VPPGRNENTEWLEADGLGGFASGTLSGVRTRRYQALLLAATAPPTGRTVLVNGFDAWVETERGRFALSSQRYAPDATAPDGASRLASFTDEPWPHWSFRLDDGTLVEQELFVPRGTPLVALCWRIHGAKVPATLTVRPFLSGRDYHALHHANPDFRFEAERHADQVAWRPYASVPEIVSLANGGYVHEPHWYRNFLYEEERARGLDHMEDLASPGVFRFDLARGEAILILATGSGAALLRGEGTADDALARLRGPEKRRREAFASRLQRAGDAYLVKRGEGQTIIAGYPWFADWGRDTFIALRGLCLATGRLAEARDILLEWSHAVSEGMLPNRFPDRPDEAPEFNSVDASLWYVVAVHEYLEAAAREETASGCRFCGARSGSACLERAVLAILEGFARGTRHGIRMDADGLLAAGEPGVQLTWMDAKVGDWVVTPRIGKPVEIQALWVNALRVGAAFDVRWRGEFQRASKAFRARFWNEAGGFLYDVVDVDHEPGKVDPAFRPNQIYAVGGLPFPLLEGDRARKVVDAVEARLLTPLGLRSLAREEPGYVGRYEGGVRERDGAYHQGTVWPWQLGAFVEAWVRVQGDTVEVRQEARERFLKPLLRHLDEAGLGHVSEIADGDAPHAPRGCPFQAWSVGEALRLELAILAGSGETRLGGSRKKGQARNHGGAQASKRVGTNLTDDVVRRRMVAPLEAYL
jgi:predicted glycogen debranching enzyme